MIVSVEIQLIIVHYLLRIYYSNIKIKNNNRIWYLRFYVNEKI